jgi:hypothetical protein
VPRTLARIYAGGMLQELDAVDLQPGSVNSIPDESREMYHRRCLHALRYLSTRHQALPSSLILQNVKPDGNRPVAGGGFAVSPFS